MLNMFFEKTSHGQQNLTQYKTKQKLIRREQFFFVDLGSPLETLGLRE